MPAKDRLKLPANPRQARERAGLTREELAFRAQVSFATVCRCEQSGEWPTQPRVRNGLAKALGLTDAEVHK